MTLPRLASLVIAVAAAVALPAVASAQEAPVQSGNPAAPVSLSLDDCLRLAVERNPDRTSALLAEQIAAIEAQRARLDRYTAQVSVSGGADVGTYKPWGGDAYRTSAVDWGTRATAAVPLYAGGSLRASVDYADAAHRIATLDRALTERSLQRAAYSAYWNIRGYELQIAAAQEGLDLTQQALDIITAKANAGLAAGIDVNRSTVDLYSQQASLIAQRSALYQAQQELLQLLHVDGDRVTLTDDPPPATTGRVSLGANAGEGRPELARRREEAVEADAQVTIARSAALPTVSLTGTAGLGGAAGEGAFVEWNADTLRPDLDASVGVQVSWNPFDLFRTRDGVREARLAAQQIEASTVSTRDAIAADLRKAASNVEQLRERVPLSDAQVALARDNLQIVQDLYAQGSATILDLFNAQASFRQARVEGAGLRVELATAEADLRWLLGADPAAVDLPAPETTP